ncbi:MAG: Fic family protein, partial [Patescibacteria group bacterium]
NSTVAEIERLRTLVSRASILPELEIQLRFRATVEAVHSSTSIEGNPLNKQQVQKVLHGEVVTAPDYAIQEVLNYKKALDWLNSREQSDEPIKVDDILHVHSILMDKLLPEEKTGHFRPGDVYIVDEIRNEETVRYTGPKAEDVPKLVSSLIQWISLQVKSSLHPILLAGLVHYLFVSIHPFSDGNGRTTRLLTYYFLKTWGYDFRGTLSLDTYYMQHQKQYYEALSRGNIFDDRMQADITPFLDFFTQGFLETANHLSQYIKVGKIINEEQKPLRLSQEELIILDYAYQFGSVTVKEAVEILSIPKRTTQRRLIRLVEKDVLMMKGEGPATQYILHQ